MRILTLFLLCVTIKWTSSTTYTCDTTATCGCSSNSAVLTKIVGGQAAGSASWGWAVSLYIGGSLCGGSIISSSWILTAAHCVQGRIASDITVYAGSNSKLSGTQTRYVSQINRHPSYQSSTYINDIALLQLSTPLDMTSSYVSAICLPSVNSGTLSAGEWPSAGTTVCIRRLFQSIELSKYLGSGSRMGSNERRWFDIIFTSTSDNANSE